MSDQGPSPGTGPGAGTGRQLADEAVRLLAALTGASASHGGPECRICPICQAIAAVRNVRPEALEHLIGAVLELAAAVREFTVPPAGTAPAGPGAAGPGATGPGAAGPQTAGPAADPSAGADQRVQHIEVTD